MQPRPFFRASVEELEKIYAQHAYNKKVLKNLEKELALRKVKSARRLLSVVRERLDEIRKRDGPRPLLSPVEQPRPRPRPVAQGSLLEETTGNSPRQKPKARKEPPQKTPQEQPPREPPAEQRPPTEAAQAGESRMPSVTMIIAVIVCLACLIFVVVSTWDNSRFGASGRSYEEQVRNLLN